MPLPGVGGEPGRGAKSILVVDDDESISALIAEILSLKGFAVSIAGNGKEALDALELSSPDLIILDMKMPVMDGWEFARRFLERYGRRPPILVMTAAADARARAREVGTEHWLAKPFSVNELLARIDVIGL